MTQLDNLTQPRPAATVRNSEATAVEQARAVAEVAAAVRVAREFPRDVDSAVEQMRRACQTKALAARAFYSVPRAGGTVEGSSVHLAREIARCWQNLDYGIRELRRDDEAGVSEMQAWAWDQEANVRSSRSFVVPHARMVGSAKKGNKRRESLTDLGDIANNNNSVAARAVRETIFTVLPVWFREDAEDIAMQTLQGHGGGQSVEQQVSEGIAYFTQQFGVTRQQLEDRLGRPAGQWTPQDVGFLQVLSGELSRGEKRVDDEFPKPGKAAAVTADDLKGGPPADTPDPTDGSDPWAGGQS
jgi:hypothetical protein